MEVELTELNHQKDMRRGIVNRELMMLYGHDVTGYLPPLPSQDQPRRSLAKAWDCPNQAMRQLSSTTRRGPRTHIARQKLCRESLPHDNIRPHSSYESHVKSILNTQISDVRPATSNGKIESSTYSLPYHKLGPVENVEGLIQPRKLPPTYANDWGHGMSNIAKQVLSGNGLRRPRINGHSARKKTDKKERARGGGATQNKYKAEDIMRVIKGDLTDIPPDIPSQVKIYICSTPTDYEPNMEAEKHYLGEHAYPVLRCFAQQHGLEIRFIDVAMGNDLDNQKNINYKLQQLRLCQQQSIGPYFVLLLGDRYGPATLPVTLTEKEYTALCKVAEEHLLENKYLLDEYYTLDTNVTQPVMRLQVDCLDDLLCFHMRKLMKEAVRLAVQTSRVDESLSDRTRMSALDQEVRVALSKKTDFSPNNKSLCFHRQFLRLKENFTDAKVPLYLDLVNSSNNRGVLIDTGSWSQHESLISFVQGQLGENNMKQYPVSWTGGGIQEDVEEHQDYLKSICADFVEGVKRLIEFNIPLWDVNHKHLALYKEVQHHSKICKNHLDIFVGRESELSNVKEYLTKDSSSSYPLVILGEEGVGKSAFVAGVAEKAKDILGNGVVKLVRFLGTSPRSEKLHHALQDLCSQISVIYKIDPPSSEDMASVNQTARVLNSYLHLISRHHGEKKPLLIILDGLDQLLPDDRAHSLFWLPKLCPSYVHIILTVDLSKRQLLGRLNTHIKVTEHFLKLKWLSYDDAKALMHKILRCEGRTLTHLQKETMEAILAENTQPLFVHSLVSECCQWTSQMQVDPSYLPTDLEDGLTKKLYRLEDSFGENLVREAVFYLTLFRHGISEVELRDTLSVLPVVHMDVMEGPSNDMVQRQINYSSTLDNSLTSLLEQLKPLLTTAKIHGRTLFQWRHSTFKKQIRDMYFGSDEYEFKEAEAYNVFVELFTQEDGIVKTFDDSFTESCGVMPQQLIASNIRKLQMLPETIRRAGSMREMLVMFKTHVACNFPHLMISLEAMAPEELCTNLDLFTIRDIELDLVKKILQKSMPGLRTGAEELPLQILGMMPWLDNENYPFINQIIRDAQQWVEQHKDTALVPLLQCFPDITDPCLVELWSLMEIIMLTKKNNLAVAKNKDGFIEIWDLANFEMAFATGIKYDKVTPNVFCNETKILGINAPQNMQVWEIVSGELLQEINLQELLATNITSMSCMCYSANFDKIVLSLSDEDFNQSVVVIDTNEKEIELSLTSFDVKDEFFAKAATLVSTDTKLVFANARSEVVDKDSMKTSDFVKLRVYDMESGKPLHSISCGVKAVNRLLKKDERIVLISWKDCSFDAYDVKSGAHKWRYNAPESSLQIQDCALTGDGYLVALGHTHLEAVNSHPHFGLWFWNLDDQVAGELVVQTLTHPNAIPTHFVVLEDLHMVVLGIPGQAKLCVWDLPTSSMLCSLQAHTEGLDSILKTEDSYQVYTCSHTEKVVKLWDLYPSISKSPKDDTRSVPSIDIGETWISASGESVDGILKRSRSRQLCGQAKRAKSVRFVDEVHMDDNGRPVSADHEDSLTSSACSLVSHPPSEHQDLASADPDSRSEVGSLAASDASTLETNIPSCYSSRDKPIMMAQAAVMYDVTSALFSTDSKFVVVGSEKRPPVVWNASDGTVHRKMTPHSNLDYGTPMVRLACKDELVVGFTTTENLEKEDWPKLYKYQVWDRETGSSLHPKNGEEDIVTVAGNVSKDGEKAVLVTLNYYDPDGQNKPELLVLIFSIQEHVCLRRLVFLSPYTPAELQLSDDALYAVTLTPTKSNPEVKNMTVLGLEVEEGKHPECNVYEYQRGKKHRKYGATRNCLLHNALSLAVGMNGDIQMWDITSCQYEGNLFHDPSEKDTRNPSLHNHGGKAILHMVVSCDRHYLLCGAADGVASLWDLDNEIMLCSYRGHSSAVCQVAISNDNQLVLTAGEDHRLFVWQFGVVEKPLCQLYIHLAPISLVLSPDKQTVVAIGAQQNKHHRFLMFRLKNLKDTANAT